MNILIVEDDFDVSQNMRTFLEACGYSVETATNGLNGLDLSTATHFDVILLDIGLPKINGLDLCKRLRKLGFSTTGIIMATARDELEDKLVAFRSGADDYIVKPFALVELKCRIEALMKRRGFNAPGGVLRVADMVYEPQSCTITRAGDSIHVSRIGRILLQCLMENTHRVVSRAELEKLIWGNSPPSPDALKTHLYALREKIDKPYPQKLIKNVRGVGYRITADDETR